MHGASQRYKFNPNLRPFDYVDGDLHGRNCSPVLEPVHGIPVLWPAYPRPVVLRDSISVVGDRSLEDIDDAWSVLVVVNRSEHSARVNGHHPHSKLASRHALDLRAEVDGCKQLHGDASSLRCVLIPIHRALLAHAASLTI